MEKKTIKEITTKTSIYYDVDEIAELLIAESKLAGGAVYWDEYSGGGIRGCTVTRTAYEAEEVE